MSEGVSTQTDSSPADFARRGLRRVVVGVGDLAVANGADDVIVTHALGSCVAVCVFDPIARVAAMLHFMLPESSINVERGRVQPAVFADTGIPALFDTASRYGLEKRRSVVKLVGGAEIVAAGQSAFRTGRRNALAARQVLWRHGVLVNAEDTGSNIARTVHFTAHDGRVQVISGSDVREI